MEVVVVVVVMMTMTVALYFFEMDPGGQQKVKLTKRPKMASQVLRDETKKGKARAGRAGNDAIMLAACLGARLGACVPPRPPNFRALTLMSKAGAGR